MCARKLQIAWMAGLLLAAAVAPAAAAPRAVAAGSTWHNELGSTLTVNTYNSTTGQFSGTYITAVASPGCQAVGKPQAMIGWLNTPSNAMTFAVNWTAAGCNSVTSWSGRFNPANGQIPTIWTLTSSSGWANMNIGTNLFVP